MRLSLRSFTTTWRQSTASCRPNPLRQMSSNLRMRKGTTPLRPHFTYDRHPLPLVGDRGWWFVSFAPPSFFTAVMGMAILYIPVLILLVSMSGVNASFSVLLRRDYGPLLTCGLMAWAASHIPFTLAGFALEPLGLSEKTALGLWAASAICFGLLMALGLRMLFGINYS